MKSVCYFFLLLLFGLSLSLTVVRDDFQRQNLEFQSSAATEEVPASSLVSCSSICSSRSNCGGYEPPSGGTCKLHFSPVTLVSNPTSSVYVKKEVTTPQVKRVSTITEATTTELTTTELTTTELTTIEPTTTELPTTKPTTTEFPTIERPTTESTATELTTIEPTTTELTTTELTTSIISTATLALDGFIEYASGRWVKTHKSIPKMTWSNALADCRGTDYPNAHFFVPKSVSDVDFMVSERRRIGIDDTAIYWMGLNDENDESETGMNSWKWVDGTVVDNLHGMQLKGSNAFDDDVKDYAMFKVDTDVPKFEFYSIATEGDGYTCELYIQP